MMCPRCGNEWDVSKSPCSRCGLLVHLPGRSGAAPRSFTPPEKSSPQIGGASPIKQPSNETDVKMSQSMPMPSMPMSTPRSSQEPTKMSPMSQPLAPSQGQNGGFSASARPMPGQSTPRPSGFPSPTLGQENTGSTMPKSNPMSGQAGASGTNYLTQKSVPQRPQGSSTPAADPWIADMQRSQTPLRPKRLVTDSLTQPRSGQPMPNSSSFSSPASQQSFAPENNAFKDVPMLIPGTLLRGGRYRLQELQERQDWATGVYEAMWIAQDAQRSGAQVMLCELVVPESGSMMMQSVLRTATMALTSVGRHPHIPTLWDAFSDQGRNFFVFEPTDGDSLLTRMRRTGHALSEQDVVECCLQMTEVLELLSQQSPALIHGLINPEHIMMGRFGSNYTLTNFSIVLAGGANQFISGMERSHLSPYTAPEFVRGLIDGRADLYSLVATAYHVVTGSVPVVTNGTIPMARRLNPNVSPQLDAILAKGLRLIPTQRYQRPSELRQELLAMRAVNGSLSVPNVAMVNVPQMQVPTQARPTQPAPVQDSVANLLPNMLAQSMGDDDEDKRALLPRPEDLPPMEQVNDSRQAMYWLSGILVVLIALVIMSRGLF